MRFTPLIFIAALALPGCATSLPTVPQTSAPTVWPDAAALTGSWDLETVKRTKAPNTLSVTFGPGNVVSGMVTCNSWAGTYRLQPPAIAFSDDIIITTAGCHPRFSTAKELVVRAEESFWRHQAVFLSADGSHLYIQGADLLTFVRKRQ